MTFIVQLVSFVLLFLAVGIKAVKDGLKNFNWMSAINVFSEAQNIFNDFRKKWTALRNEWKEIDFTQMGAEVKEKFTFLEDRDLENLLENIAVSAFNIIGGVFGLINAFKLFLAYLKTEDISNKPNAEKSKKKKLTDRDLNNPLLDS